MNFKDTMHLEIKHLRELLSKRIKESKQPEVQQDTEIYLDVIHEIGILSGKIEGIEYALKNYTKPQ